MKNQSKKLLGTVMAVLAFVSINGASSFASDEVLVTSSNLKAGDGVKLYQIKDDCRWPAAVSSSSDSCRVEVGSGVVSKDLGQKHFLIKATGSINSSKGLIAEKS